VWVLICASLLVLGLGSVATGATGGLLRLGKRNTASRTTAIVGNTTRYATRQSNRKENDGGGASYGCRADIRHEACLFALNHRGGFAFRFKTKAGVSGGTIDVRPPAGKSANDVAPLTTNAHGVATGFNADRVDGQSASDLIAAAVARVQPLFAAVNADGTIAGNRGLAQSGAVQHVPATGTYTVTFASDISKCAYTATEATTTDAGAAALARVPGRADQLQVVTRAGGGPTGTDSTAPADRPFHLVVNC
jgi:hypothetical protein